MFGCVVMFVDTLTPEKICDVETPLTPGEGPKSPVGSPKSPAESPKSPAGSPVTKHSDDDDSGN